MTAEGAREARRRNKWTGVFSKMLLARWLALFRVLYGVLQKASRGRSFNRSLNYANKTKISRLINDIVVLKLLSYASTEMSLVVVSDYLKTNFKQNAHTEENRLE